MGTITITPRPLSAPEHALVSRLLDFALDSEHVPAYRSQLADLRVIELCDCGCPSVLFDTDRPELGARRTMVADVYATTPEGYAVGLLLWAVARRLEYLELYALGDWPAYRLPAPGTVSPEYPSAAPAS
jgi:hypothetical protein